MPNYNKDDIMCVCVNLQLLDTDINKFLKYDYQERLCSIFVKVFSDGEGGG